MCGRYVLFTDDEHKEIREIINEIESSQKDKIINMKTGEIFPTNIVPIITSSVDNKRTVNLFKWGFPNYKQTSGVIINARGEGIEEKSTFKKALYTKRCLIPACGFYEWKTLNKQKDKYLIKPENHNFFYMAGLYNSFIAKNGEAYNGFVIITADANEQMSKIHNRMPIILTEKDKVNGWINNSMSNLADIKSYLQPYKNNLHFENMSTQLQFSI